MSIRGQAFSLFIDAASRLITGKPRERLIEFKLPASRRLRGKFANNHICVVGGFLSDKWKITIVDSMDMAGDGIRRLNLNNRTTHSNASMANWAEQYLSSLPDVPLVECENIFAAMKSEAARWGSSAFKGKTTLADYSRNSGKKEDEQAVRMTHLDMCRAIASQTTAQQLAL